jgi:hypothetical protein
MLMILASSGAAEDEDDGDLLLLEDGLVTGVKRGGRHFY